MGLRTSLRSFVVASALVVAVLPAFAQGDPTGSAVIIPPRASQGLTVGVSFAGGATLTTEETVNYKVSPVFAYKTGVDATYPVSQSIFATLGLGLDRRGGRYYWYRDATVWEQRMVNYFSINPGIRFSSFYLGLNLGIPMSGLRTWQNGLDADANEVEVDTDVDELNLMVEPQIGAIIPLLDEEIGWLGLTLIAGYNVSNITDSQDFLPGQTSDKPVDLTTPSLRLGFTWQFGIPGTAR